MILEFIKTAFFLFAVIDPIGSIPVYLEATKNFDQKTKKKVAIDAIIISGLILIFFIVVGQVLMEIMEISLDAFQISGGVILFLFALTMILGEGKVEGDIHLIKDHTHVTVFPIAIPSIASPGAILTVVILTDNHKYTVFEQFLTTLDVVLILGITFLFLSFSRIIQKKIGEAGIIVISKIMGLILASFAVQNILLGIKAYYKI